MKMVDKVKQITHPKIWPKLNKELIRGLSLTGAISFKCYAAQAVNIPQYIPIRNRLRSIASTYLN